jgi:hypothetical protein
VDFDFTARMEDDLDRIAAGEKARVEWLGRFYFGDGTDPGLHHLVTDHLDEIDARAVNSIDIPLISDSDTGFGNYYNWTPGLLTLATLDADIQLAASGQFQKGCA